MQDCPERGSSHASNTLGSRNGDEVDASETLGLRPDDTSSHAENALGSGNEEEVSANETPRLRPEDVAVAQDEDFDRARRYDPTNAAQLAEDQAMDLDKLDDDDQRRRLESSRSGRRPIKVPRKPRARQAVPQPMGPATKFDSVLHETPLSAPVTSNSEMNGVQTAPMNGHPSFGDPSLSAIQTNGHHAAPFPPLPWTQVDGLQPATINEGGSVEMGDETPAIGQEPGPAQH